MNIYIYVIIIIYIITIIICRCDNSNHILIHSKRLFYFPYLNLPSNFLFGASTSGYQIEGNLKDSNFAHFEKKTNLELSGQTCNSWNCMDEDIKAIKKLHLNTYRMSIEWARLQPEEYKWNNRALNKYIYFIKELVKNKIQPIITLVHFVIPEWLEQKGGFSYSQFPQHFLNFSKRVIDAIHPYSYYLITFNEPMLMIMHSYLLGTRPPGKVKAYKEMWYCLKNICKSHILFYQYTKKHYPLTKISVAENLTISIPKNDINPLDLIGSIMINETSNFTILDALKTGKLKFLWLSPYINKSYTLSQSNTLDYTALNHYNRVVVGVSFTSHRYTNETKNY